MHKIGKSKERSLEWPNPAIREDYGSAKNRKMLAIQLENMYRTTKIVVL